MFPGDRNQAVPNQIELVTLFAFDEGQGLSEHTAPFDALVQVLEGEGAVVKYRDVMGATDPAKAAANTIRKVHAKSIGENSVHGSDAADTAAKEISQFFAGKEIVG